MNLAAFLTYAITSAFTPGPNTIMSMEEGIRVGFRRSSVFIAGMTAGFIVLGLLCGAVTGAVTHYLPSALTYLKIAGSVYILWLAWRILFPVANGTDPASRSTSRRAAFLRGMVLQFVNVKIILYFLTTLSVFILPHSADRGYVLGYIGVLCAICAAGNVLWAGFGSLFKRFFANHRRPISIILAAALAYCVVMIWV